MSLSNDQIVDYSGLFIQAEGLITPDGGETASDGKMIAVHRTDLATDLESDGTTTIFGPGVPGYSAEGIYALADIIITTDSVLFSGSASGDLVIDTSTTGRAQTLPNSLLTTFIANGAQRLASTNLLASGDPWGAGGVAGETWDITVSGTPVWTVGTLDATYVFARIG